MSVRDLEVILTSIVQADLEKQWQEAAIQAARGKICYRTVSISTCCCANVKTYPAGAGQEALSHLSSHMVSRKEVKEFARRSLGGKMGKGGVRRHTKAWKELWRKKECYVEALSEEGLMTWGEVRFGWHLIVVITSSVALLYSHCPLLAITHMYTNN